MTPSSPPPLIGWLTVATAVVGAVLSVVNFATARWERRPYLVYAPSPTDPLTMLRVRIHNPSRRHLQVVKVTSRRQDTEVRTRIIREGPDVYRDVRDGWIEEEGGFYVYIEPQGSRTIEAYQIQPRDHVVFRLHWHRHDWRRHLVGVRVLQLRFVVDGRRLEEMRS